jgi:hypothetical protein
VSNVDTVKRIDEAFGRGDIPAILAQLDAFKVPYEGHLWVFNGAGKVVKFQHVTDTAQHWRMANM